MTETSRVGGRLRQRVEATCFLSLMASFEVPIDSVSHFDGKYVAGAGIIIVDETVEFENRII